MATLPKDPPYSTGTTWGEHAAQSNKDMEKLYPKLISIPIEEFQKLERIKALYEEALEVIEFVAFSYKDRELHHVLIRQVEILIKKAREFLEKVKNDSGR